MKGRVFSVAFSPDDSLTVAAAGSKAKLQIWDVGANFGARKAFVQKFRDAGKVFKERDVRDGDVGGLIGVISEGEESDEDAD